jgi:hypothetical protein
MATKTHIVRTEEDQVENAVQIRSDDPGSPVSNQTWINTTDKKMKFYDGSDIQNVGAAGVGSASTFALFQAEDGDISSFTNMAIESASPIAGDKSYSISSLPAAAPSISVDERRAGSTCVVSLMSRLTSGSGKIVVKDNSSNVLESLIVSGTSAEKVVIDFGIPAAATSIQISFEDESSATGWVVDDIEFTDNPFVYKDLVKENYVRAQGTGITTYTLGTAVPFTEVTDSANAFDGTTYTVQKSNSRIKISGSVRFSTVAARNIHIYKNGSNYKLVESDNSANHPFAYLSSVGEFDVGDQITIVVLNNGGTLQNDTVIHYLNIVEQEITEHVVTPAKVVDEFYRARNVASGSTNTAIAYWDSDIVNETGELISIASNATDGMSITALKDVVVTASYNVRSATGGAQNLGWSLNSNQLTTNILSITSAHRLKYTGNTSTPSESYSHDATVQIKLSAGDVLRPHTGGTITSADAGQSYVNILARAANAEFLAAVPMNYTQTKTLSANFGTTLTTISDLTFNNLIPGRVYEAIFNGHIALKTGSGGLYIEVRHDGNTLGTWSYDSPSSDNTTNVSNSLTVKFTATADTLTFYGASIFSSYELEGNGTKAKTHAILTELNYTKETTRFS